MMPWRLAYCPVRIEARLGEQSGVVWKAREHRPFMADTVDVRCLHIGMAADPQLVEPQIVDQDDQEIRFAACRHVPSPCRALVSTRKGTLACRNLPCLSRD